MRAHDSLILASQETKHRALFGAAAHQAADIGLGSALTFGLGNSGGQEIANQITDQFTSRIAAFANFTNFGNSGAPDSARGVALHFARAAIGHVGASLGRGLFNTAAPYLAASLVNMIPCQFAPNDARELVPQEKVDLMNELVPGAGDALRVECSIMQGAAATLSSASSIRAGEWGFDSANGARGAALANQALHPVLAVAAGTLVSALGGLGTGLGMACQQATATVAVPRLAALESAVRAAHGDPGSATQRLDSLIRHDCDNLNLFKVVKPAVSTAQAYHNAFKNSPLRAPKPRAAPNAPRSMVQQANAVALTVANVCAAVADRSVEMSKATAATSAMTAVTKLAIAGGADKNAARITAAVGLAVAIHVSVAPFHKKLGEIAARDAARLQRNQAAADQAHASRQVTPTATLAPPV